MALSAAQLGEWLLQSGLLTTESIVDGALSIEDVSRRNRNFRVTTKGGSCFFVKQAFDRASRAFVETEASICAGLWRPEHNMMHPFLPRLHVANQEEGVLIFDLIEGARDFAQYHRRLGRFPTGPAVLLGEALATLHGLEASELGEGPARSDLGNAEAILSIHRPTPEILHTASWADLEVIKEIQRPPDLGEHIDALRESWQDRCLIHADLKWENILLTYANAKKPRLALVDWEFAGLGDPRWDVGSVLAGYLAFWIGSIPQTGESGPERLAEHARFPLQVMHASLSAFWQSYVDHTPTEAAPRASLRETVKFSAVWLLHTAQAQAHVSVEASQHTLLLIQVALNILRQPEQAIAALGLNSVGELGE